MEVRAANRLTWAFAFMASVGCQRAPTHFTAGGGDTSVASGAWHTLGVTARGAAITVRWDGSDVITATDSTFTRGKVGLWTRADSVTSFDDLEVTAE